MHNGETGYSLYNTSDQMVIIRKHLNFGKDVDFFHKFLQHVYSHYTYKRTQNNRKNFKKSKIHFRMKNTSINFHIKQYNPIGSTFRKNAIFQTPQSIDFHIYKNQMESLTFADNRSKKFHVTPSKHVVLIKPRTKSKIFNSDMEKFAGIAFECISLWIC